ncbi:MAG: ferrous iron transport protein A [Cyclobacteriaceae bacterium]|jgi:ferrous iron transport protein A|nr:ferrous iron transport protein A [Cyclobacteriaceae bacterium]
MDSGHRNVAQMKPGEVAIISDLLDEFVAVKLMEMGCLPGATIRFNFRAPLGDPICITVSGYELSLRIEEASTISILD